LGDALIQLHCPSSYPIDNWYYSAVPEAQMFGKIFTYGGLNDGDAMLFAGRLMQIVLTLLTGAVIFLWTRRATNDNAAALAGLALWVFNPAALGYGHVVNTDMGVTFGITLAVYRFARFLEQPSLRNAALCGAATGVAMSMKFTTLILGPAFVLAVLLSWKKLKLSLRDSARMGGGFVLVAWGVILIAYLPHWAPAPPPSERDAAFFNIPAWFATFRPVLIPPGFFKGIAIALGHAGGGHDGYLLGEWSHTGWWYFFPLVFVLKSPVALVILVAAALVLFCKHCREVRVLESTVWLVSAVYLAVAMQSRVNIGVRHLLPMFAMLSVGVGCAVSRLTNRKIKIATAALLGWQAISALLAYPLYIQFFSEAVGGARNGYKYLVDSSFDWGQDAKRLQKFLRERQIDHIYLDYFGNQYSIEYLKIPNTRIDAEHAKQIRQGTLVVSASQLMRPEWDWLRNSRPPTARVAHTLFVYQFP
jgi:4-amino-4-deoxy-L-arabinose transferase-like glycosyltransferase